MQLYYMDYENDDGESLSLFITADSPEAAVQMFRAEWTDILKPTDFAGPVHISMATDYDILRISTVNPTGVAGVLRWHSDGTSPQGSVDLVGWAYP